MKTTEQAAKFGIVGALNTFIDFLALNTLVYFGFIYVWTIFGQKFLIANVISVSIAMINSFIFNKFWVFRGDEGGLYFQIIKFLVITVVGMFVIHQLIFSFLYYNFNFLFDGFFEIAHYFGLAFFSRDFIALNLSKITAIIGSLVWNFIGYKFIVFKSS